MKKKMGQYMGLKNIMTSLLCRFSTPIFCLQILVPRFDSGSGLQYFRGFQPTARFHKFIRLPNSYHLLIAFVFRMAPGFCLANVRIDPNGFGYRGRGRSPC